MVCMHNPHFCFTNYSESLQNSLCLIWEYACHKIPVLISSTWNKHYFVCLCVLGDGGEWGGGGGGGGGGRGEASRQALQVQHQLQRSLIFIYYREIWYGDSHICMEKKKRKCQYQKVSYLITDIPFVDYLQYSIYYLGLKGQFFGS